MNLIKSSALKSSIAAFLAVSFSAGNALAQQLEEITVTARKSEESLQDVPISVTAFSAAQLQDMGLNDNEQVAYMTVNFNNVSQIGRRLDRPVIRGMSAPSTFGEPNASFFIDGAYVSGSISTLTLGPVERVEILRGPQSTQFGRATFSGAVNYVTRKPTNEMAGEVTLEAASHDTRKVAAWASGPIIEDTLMFFASGSYDEYGGEWSNNLAAGAATSAGDFIDPPQQGDKSDIGGTRTKQAEGKLMWAITESSDLTFKLGYNEADDQHYPQLIVETDEMNCFVPGVDLQPGDPGYDTSPGNYCGELKSNGRENRLNLPDLRTGMTGQISNNPPPGTSAEDFISEGEDVGTQQERWNGLIQYDHDFSDWLYTARVAYNKNDLETAYDLDHVEKRPFLGLFHMYAEDDREDWSFETRISSPVENRLRGSLGVYYYDFEQDVRQHSNVGLAAGQLGDARTNKTENIAAFGSLEYDFTEKFSGTVELRVARDTKKIDSPISCDDPTSEYFDPGNDISDEVESDSLTPRFSLRYFATPEAMLYAQVAKGNKPGNYNLGFFTDGVDGCSTADQLESDDGLAFVDEEKAWNYEVGAKTTWLDNRIITNLAFFYIDWENQTVFETVNIDRDFLFAPQAVGINAGKSEVYGMELETSMAITENLTGTFGYGLTVGELKEYFSGSLEDLTGDGNARGNDIPNSSKHNFVTSLQYTNTLTSQLDWFAFSSFSFESKKYTSATNTEEIGNRRLWNARSGLEHEGWRFSLFVNNILDEQTPSAILGFPDLNDRWENGVNKQGYALTPTPGRSAGAELIVRFGN